MQNYYIWNEYRLLKSNMTKFTLHQNSLTVSRIDFSNKDKTLNSKSDFSTFGLQNTMYIYV